MGEHVILANDFQVDDDDDDDDGLAGAQSWREGVVVSGALGKGEQIVVGSEVILFTL